MSMPDNEPRAFERRQYEPVAAAHVEGSSPAGSSKDSPHRGKDHVAACGKPEVPVFDP